MPAAIDVLLPYYGGVDHFIAAVDSIMAQTFTDFQLLIIDDGYPDPRPEEYCQALLSQDSRVSYEKNSENLGANGNYRKALAKATAELVVVMGADDIMHPGFLAKASTGFRRFPHSDIMQCGVHIVDEHSQPVTPLVDTVKRLTRPHYPCMTTLGGEQLLTSLMRGNWTYFPSLVWKRDTITQIGFREGLDVVQDLALLCDVILAGGELIIDNEPVFSYRRHSGSDSSVRALDGRRFIEEKQFFTGLSREFATRGYTTAAATARLRPTSRLNALSLMPQALRRGQYSGARTLLAHAVTA